MATTKRLGEFEAMLQDPVISVLIIGGGIKGAGVFRDLALQGVDVLLVDKGDFCSGASAATSHMVHGGVRYLENVKFRLVREAVRERNRLLNNAPHYVRPPRVRRQSAADTAQLRGRADAGDAHRL